MAVPRRDPLQPPQPPLGLPARGVRPVKLAEGESTADHEAASNPHPGYVADDDFSAAEGFMRKVSAGLYTLHKSNLQAAADPTVNDDASDGYSEGSRWNNQLAATIWQCVDASNGAAVWKNISASGAHDALTIGVDGEHSLAAQVLSGVDASATQKGHAELATAAEAAAGTDAARVPPVSVLPVLIQNSKYVYAADAGGTDAYAITLTPAPAAYAAGQVFHFKANTANTGAATLNVNGLGAIALEKMNGTVLADGDIAANQIVSVVYNATGPKFQMLSQIANAPAAGAHALTDAN